MSDRTVEFQWDVHEGGHQWINTTTADPQSKGGLFLTDSRPLGARGFAVKRFNPLHHYSGLFRNFAATPPTTNGIKAFADKFGMLGGDASTMIVLPDRTRGKCQLVGLGERSRDWVREILTMRQLDDLWDMARRGDAGGLAPFIQWRKKGVFYDSHPKLRPKERPKRPFIRAVARISTGHSGDPSEAFHGGDLIEPALCYAQGVINDRLKDRVSSRLLWDPHRSRLKLHVVPDSLLGAIWLQFARAIENKSEFRICVECAMWFELSPQTGRSDKIYCSDACRMRAYRKRKSATVS